MQVEMVWEMGLVAAQARDSRMERWELGVRDSMDILT